MAVCRLRRHPSLCPFFLCVVLALHTAAEEFESALVYLFDAVAHYFGYWALTFFFSFLLTKVFRVLQRGIVSTRRKGLEVEQEVEAIEKNKQ